jgi:hypothetical protein
MKSTVTETDKRLQSGYYAVTIWRDSMSLCGHASDAWLITREVAKRGFETYDYVGTEIRPRNSGCRFDIVGIKASENIVKIIEVKSCRTDFLSDKKWKNYLDYATHFYFAAPEGSIFPDELPDGIGLIEFRQGAYGPDNMRCTKMAKRLHDVGYKQHIGILEALLYSVNRDKRIK